MVVKYDDMKIGWTQDIFMSDLSEFLIISISGVFVSESFTTDQIFDLEV